MGSTNNTDFIKFLGDMQSLTLTLVNPYSGELLEIGADFLVNSQSYDGLGGFDYLLLSSSGDALFLDGSSFSNDPNTADSDPSIQNIEYIAASSGSDIINLASYINTMNDIQVNGGGGNDIIWTNDGDDIIAGADGNDHIVTGSGNDRIQGLNDDDYLNGGLDADYLEGGNGNDRLKYSADSIWDNSLSTPLYNVTGLNRSHDVFDGGADYDVLELTDGSDALLITDDLSDRHASANGDRIRDIEEIKADGGDDIIDLDNDATYQSDIQIHGDQGHDFVRSGSGNDIIYGGAGDDQLYGGAGDDILYGGNNDGTIEVQEHLFSDAVHFPTLQERKHIKKLLPPGDPALGIAEGDLSVAYSTTATFTFQESGAGYRNTLGFYRISHVDGTIEGVEVGFANVKNYKAGTGYTVNLPGAPDSDFGFFIIANGYNRNKSYKNLDIEGSDHLKFVYDLGGANERAATIFDDGDDISLVYDDGATFKVLKGNIYHTTARDGDTALNRDDAEHVVSGLLDEGDRTTLRIGFEDLKNLGDADYNDVVFDLQIEGKSIDTSEAGNDVLVGGTGNDQLYGEGGHDLLIIGDGQDIAYGGSGHDIFALDKLDGDIDTIADYNFLGDQDIINVADVLDGYDPLNDAIEDFIQFSTTQNGDVVLQVHDGTEFVDAVRISGGLGGKTVQEMVDAGQLIVDQTAV